MLARRGTACRAPQEVDGRFHPVENGKGRRGVRRSGLLDLHFLGILPQPMNIAIRGGKELPGLLDLELRLHRMIRIHGSVIGAINRLPVGGELEIPNLIGKLFPLSFENKLNPSDVVFL